MEIKTKFTIGEPVWFIHHTRAEQASVESIHIFSSCVTYSLTDHLDSKPENECFATKEELLKHVAGE